ncbi:MAG: ABC transporter permease, partial [Holophagales bacterium]|nr:ABC transporter permease [Holophagales bacterium]
RPGFQGQGVATGLYLPLASAPWVQELLEDRENTRVLSWLRLAPGVTREQLRSRLEVIARGLDEAFPLAEPRRFVAPSLDETSDMWAGDPLRQGAEVLMAAVGLLLLLACANVANLMLARTHARERELSVHAALGAGKLRLGRRLLFEALLLSAAGGIAGLLLARRALASIETYLLHSVPVFMGDWSQGSSLSFDSTRMSLFFLAVVAATGVLFGLAPLAHAWRLNLVEGLKAGRRDELGRRFGLRRVLVVAQVALSLVLLTSAGLLGRTLWNARDHQLGFPVGHQLLATVYLPPGALDAAPAGSDGELTADDPDRPIREVYHRFAEAARALPGVRAAGLAVRVPPSFTSSLEAIVVATGERRRLGFNAVGDGYFDALGVPVLQGRDFDARDRHGKTRVAVVARGLAEQLWPTGGALGQRLRILEGDDEVGKAFEVVGVVGDVQQSAPVAEQEPILYLPFDERFHRRSTLILDGDRSLLPALRGLLRDTFPELAVVNLQPLSEQVRRSLTDQRMNADFGAGFGMLGLFLAGLGIFSVLSYEV